MAPIPPRPQTQNRESAGSGDERADRHLLGTLLTEQGDSVVLSEDGDEAWFEFRRAKPDVVVADWLLPGTSGVELCRRIREDPSRPYTYIVVVTGLRRAEHALEAMRSGADAHLPKPIDPLSLEARMVAAERVTALHAMLLDQRRHLVDLHREASAGMRTDPVTGTGNRLRLAEDLEVVRARASRYGQRYWMALCGLDRFGTRPEPVRGGPSGSNELLREVATALRRAARRSDVLYRTGSDEFLVLLPEQDAASAARAGERLRAAVEGLRVPHAGNRPWGVLTTTVAVSPFLTEDEDVSHSLARIEDLLAVGKRAGRNRVAAVEEPFVARGVGAPAAAV